MSFENLFGPIEELTEYKKVVRAIETGNRVVEINGISDTQKALMTAAVRKRFQKPCLMITYDDLTAKKVMEDLSFFGETQAVFFPERETIFYHVDARSNEIRQNRIRAEQATLFEDCPIVCTTMFALMNKMMDPEAFRRAFRRLTVGGTVEIDRLKHDLIYTGYERVDMVEGRGQFSIRGGIVDIFPPTEDNPVRIELFDDEVDSIRTFDVLTQRSQTPLQSCEISPRRELLMEAADFERAHKAMEAELNRRSKKQEKLRENLGFDLERMKEGIYFEGIEKYTYCLLSQAYSFLDYMGDCIVVVDESARVRQSTEAAYELFSEQYKDFLATERALPSQIRTLFRYEEVLSRVCENQTLVMNTLLRTGGDFSPQAIVGFTTRTMQPFFGKPELLLEEITELKRKRYRIVILSGSAERGKRLAYTLQERNIDAIFRGSLDFPLQEGHIVILPGTIGGSFDFPSIRYAVISDREVYGVKQSAKRKKKKEHPIKNFTDLKVGDYVVHENHGIGRYTGIEKIKVDGVWRDYLHIAYAGTDKLFIPTDQLDLIQRYIGSGDRDPKLNKLGGSEWAKAKQRAKKSIDDIADELIALYAKRQAKIGFQFSPDSKWQREFEDYFPYEETQDQLRCVEEIKADMESPRVMDRLLCGDVGYGKTEVALRAAFKAVMDAKQVAILVPTTILAQQHYNTAKERFANFPVKIEMLSRFNSPSEHKRIIRDLKTGNVDVVIGTHTLLGNAIEYKDLGLLIVDEEQRFGVKHKEKIKQLATNIDVLTLTATPIPRTLHMSMTGIRDISVINEPPEERFPVQTYVMEQNDEIVRDAIVREMARSGQVYYLYNRVRTINKVAAKLKELVPDARIAVGHGQMAEHALEETMLDFYNSEYDVLVSTTIIETGLDIPNVNTIIIEDADKLGLAQLYQLRGRVGRSNRVAHAYLLYQKDKMLNTDAEKRLQAVKEFTEFGSGFKIAMRDLEIRGAGDLLGSAQSGHMDSVGYDFYVKLLEERLSELKGEVKEEKRETTLELSVNAHIPDDYIEDNEQKIEIYKKIIAVENQQDFDDVWDELVDRYGDLPESVVNLMNISYCRAIGKQRDISNISQKKDMVVFKFHRWNGEKNKWVAALSNVYQSRMLFSASNPPYITLRVGAVRPERLLERIKEFLDVAPEQ